MSCFLTQPAYSGSVCGCKWDLVFDWCSFSLGPGPHFLKADGWLWRGVVGCGATFVGRRGDGFQALLRMDALELGLNHIIVTVIALCLLSLDLFLIGVNTSTERLEGCTPLRGSNQKSW